jgi:hypothetical protein
MMTELVSAISARINDLHDVVLESTSKASASINDAMLACVEIGGHIAELPRGQRMAWLRDNCPKLNHKQIAAYLSISATHKKRPDNAIDHRFFTLIGMVDPVKPHPTASMAKMPEMRWLTWTARLSAHFNDVAKTTPPETWDEMERVSVLQQLEPIAKMYERIKSSGSVSN